MRKICVKGGFFTLCIILLYGCKGHQGVTVFVNPTPLEVHGDSLKFVVDLSLPEKPIKRKNFSYQAYPKIGEFYLPAIIISGEELEKNERLDTAITFSIPFSSDLNGESLSIQQQYLKNDKVKKLDSFNAIAQCCQHTSDLIKDDYRLMMSEKKSQNSPLKMVIQFNFPLNKWQLEPNPLSDDDLSLIKDFINSRDSSPSITVSGNASPDGDIQRNEFLAQQRAVAVAAWIKEVFQEENLLENIGMINNLQIEKNMEDWEGFVSLLDSTTLSANKKDKIKEVVNKDLSLEEKEEEIEKVTNESIYSLEEILSPLRKTSLVIKSGKHIKRDSEIDSIATGYVKNPESVNIEDVFDNEEWYYLSDRINGVQGERTLIAAYYKTFPDDFKVFNDLGVLSLVQDTACPLVIECEDEAHMADPGLDSTGRYAAKKTEEDYNYEVETQGAEVKIKKEGDEYTYEKETADAEVKVKYNMDENEAKYEREDPNGEVKIHFEGNEVHISTPDYNYVYDGAAPVDSLPVETVYKEEFTEALRLFEMADKMKPGQAAPSCNIACIYSLEGRYDAAQEYFEKSLKALESPEAHYNLGLIYSKQGKYDEALEQFNKAGAIKRVNFSKGLVKLLTGDLEGAQNDLQKHLFEVTNDASAYYALAIVFARMENVEQACINIQKACAVDPTYCHKALGDLEFSRISTELNFK